MPRERLWIRGAAFGVDLLVLAGVPLLLSTAVIFTVLLVSPDPTVSLRSGFHIAQAVFVAAFLGRDIGGTSPGKRLFGLKLAREDGRVAGLLTSLTRNLPLVVPGWNLLEILSVIRRADGRRFGDRAARTAIVES